MEWAKHNINVNAIAPTFIETPMIKPMFEYKAFSDYVLGNILLDRLGLPEDVVGGLIYLASGASDMVTGHILHIDGGWTAHKKTSPLKSGGFFVFLVGSCEGCLLLDGERPNI